LSLTLIALTLLLWFLGEWILFVIRIHWGLGSLRVHRAVSDERGPAAALWSGQPFRVRTEVHLTGRVGIPYVHIAEFLPFGARKTEGETSCDTALGPGGRAVLKYALRWDAPGRTRFEGATVRMGDFQGLFYFSKFIESARVYRVLPPLADAEG